MSPLPRPPKPGHLALRTRAVDEVPDMAALAVKFLSRGGPGFALDVEQAEAVVAHMRLVDYPKGAALISEGDDVGTSYMLLLLEGNVSVDIEAARADAKVDISVIGPGALIGELALLDGAPRSASCTALSRVQAVGLSRAGLLRLMESHPTAAAKLGIYVAQNTADRLRALSHQVQMYDQLAASLQLKVNELQAAAGQRT